MAGGQLCGGNTGGARTSGLGEVVDSSVDAWSPWLNLTPKEWTLEWLEWLGEEMFFTCSSLFWRRISMVTIIN